MSKEIIISDPGDEMDHIYSKKVKMKNYSAEELLHRTIQWAKNKGILDNGNALAQNEKTKEETQETWEALFAKKHGLQQYTNKKDKLVNAEDEIKDGLGDQFVTLILQAELAGYDLFDCLEDVLTIIEQRTGKMVNGQFVKKF
jgi:NTP pyrophosphatase (non-canonical NTP hydrolase)